MSRAYNRLLNLNRKQFDIEMLLCCVARWTFWSFVHLWESFMCRQLITFFISLSTVDLQYTIYTLFHIWTNACHTFGFVIKSFSSIACTCGVASKAGNCLPTSFSPHNPKCRICKWFANKRNKQNTVLTCFFCPHSRVIWFVFFFSRYFRKIQRNGCDTVWE